MMNRSEDLINLLKLLFRDDQRKDDASKKNNDDDDEDDSKLTSYIEVSNALKNVSEFTTMILKQFLHILNHIKFRRLANPSFEK